MDKTCGTCQYFFKDETNDRLSQCRKNPPTVIAWPTQDALGQTKLASQGCFPQSQSTSWCGEWRLSSDAPRT